MFKLTFKHKNSKIKIYVTVDEPTITLRVIEHSIDASIQVLREQHNILAIQNEIGLVSIEPEIPTLDSWKQVVVMNPKTFKAETRFFDQLTVKKLQNMIAGLELNVPTSELPETNGDWIVVSVKTVFNPENFKVVYLP